MSQIVKTTTIPTSEKRLKPTPHIVYKILCTRDTTSWSVCRRFSEFTNLDVHIKRLRSQYQSSASSNGVRVPELPGKSWKRYDDAGVVESRRKGLESYLQSIIKDLPVTAISSCMELLEFLSVPSSSLTSSSPKLEWTTEFRRCEDMARGIRGHLATRATSGSASQIHEATLHGRTLLASLKTILASLSASLNLDSEAIGAGETNRRRNLVLRLEGDLGHFARQLETFRTASGGGGGGAGGATTSGESSVRNQLFGLAASTSASSLTLGGNSSRKFGVITGEETDQTRALDNSGLLQLQKSTMVHQDTALDELLGIIRRQKEVGMAIGQELEGQNTMLEELDEEVDRTESRLKVADRRLESIRKG